MAGSFFVQLGKEKIEHVRIPAHGVAFNSFLDILYPEEWSISQQILSNTRHPYTRSTLLRTDDGGITHDGLTSGSSSQSDMLSAGKMIFVAPARRAATVFSRRPPIRNTLPVTVSSPVMAMVGSRGWFNASDKSELAIVIPAEGPMTHC